MWHQKRTHTKRLKEKSPLKLRKTAVCPCPRQDPNDITNNIIQLHIYD